MVARVIVAVVTTCFVGFRCWRGAGLGGAFCKHAEQNGEHEHDRDSGDSGKGSSGIVLTCVAARAGPVDADKGVRADGTERSGMALPAAWERSADTVLGNEAREELVRRFGFTPVAWGAVHCCECGVGGAALGFVGRAWHADDGVVVGSAVARIEIGLADAARDVGVGLCKVGGRVVRADGAVGARGAFILW